ncbi:MAG: oligosaccharide flippase family protein, partial [Planctomycetota bacterium]
QTLARRGTLLAVSGQIGAQLISLVVLGLLCRLVAPAQFGIYNTALLIVMLPRMFVTLGLSAASVQQPNLNDQQITAFFRLQMLLGVGAAGLSAVVGIALGWIWGAGDVGLVTVILAGSSIVLALGAQHQALLERKLRVATLLRLRLVAQATSGVVAIGLAWCGAGLWALVVQQYLELSIITLLSWSNEPWRPRRGVPAARLPNLLTSSGQAALALLCFHLAQNLDKLLLFLLIGGREGGEAVVGMYNLAFNLMMRPVYFVTTPVTGVMLPALSRAIEGQHRHQRQYQSLALNFFRFVAVALFPCAAGLWLVAHDVTRVLAGSGWTAAGWLLAALAPTILSQGLINICGSLLISANRYRELALGASVVMLVQLQGHVSGAILGHLCLSTGEALPGLGVAQGMAAAYSTVVLFVVAIPYLRFAFGSVELPWTELVRAVRPSLLATSSMTALVWATRHLLLPESCPALLRLLASAVVGVAIYALIARAEIRSALQLTSR